MTLALRDELQRRFGAPGQFSASLRPVARTRYTMFRIWWASKGRSGACKAATQVLRMRSRFGSSCGLTVSRVFGQNRRNDEISWRLATSRALGAAAAVGDDRLQRMSRKGEVSPDSFTHGTSAQRTEWFQRGMNGGTIESCNTFQ